MSDQLSDEDIDALDTIATPMAAHGLMRIVAEVRRLRADLAMANSELTAAHASWQADVARLNAEVEQLRADLATSIDNREIEAERVVEARAEAGRAKDERASLTVELWEGVRAHGLTAPTEYRERSEGARLIHAYCGGIVRALEERDTARSSLAAALARVEVLEGECRAAEAESARRAMLAGLYEGQRDNALAVAAMTATASSCTDNGSGVCTSCSTVHHIAPTAIAYVGAFAGGSPAPRTVTREQVNRWKVLLADAYDHDAQIVALYMILTDLGVEVDDMPSGKER